MVENKKVITWSLIILFLILAIVYSLSYMKNATLFKKWFESWISNTTINTNTELSGQTSVSWWINDSIWVSSNSIDLWSISNPSWVTNSHTQTPGWNESSTSNRPASTNSKILSGTNEYFGVLDIVEILWVDPKITLKDEKWNYFVYYWETLDFVKTIQNLGGNVYEMKTETEIIQNQMFWDKVSYINLSQFKDKRVMIVIEIDWDVWLIQIPADKYHTSKGYLQSLFIQ